MEVGKSHEAPEIEDALWHWPVFYGGSLGRIHLPHHVSNNEAQINFFYIVELKFLHVQVQASLAQFLLHNPHRLLMLYQAI